MQHGFVQCRWALGLTPSHVEVLDLLSGERYYWRGEWNYVCSILRGVAHICTCRFNTRCPIADPSCRSDPLDPLWYKDAVIYQAHVRAFLQHRRRRRRLHA